MKGYLRLFFIFVIIFAPLLSYSQGRGYKGKGRNYKFRLSNRFKVNEVLSVYGSLGFANYYGDLCDKLECMHPRPSIGAGLIYRLSNHISSKSELNYNRLYSADVWPDRNLHFRSGNIELYTSLMYDYFPFTKNLRARKKFSPYVFAGLGLTSYNPRAEYEGKWYSLRPLKTEGASYGVVTPIIPFGFGTKIKYTRKWDFMLEASYRITFTDHIDDVSSNKFIKKSDFNDQTAAALANRTKEGDAFQGYRGNPNKNDGYFVFSAKVRYTFTSKHTFRPKYNEQHRKVY